MSQYQVTVSQKNIEAADIVSFELVHLHGDQLPAFSAGSHIDVHIGHGLIRQYSLCNSPDETHRYVIGVLRDPKSRGGSVAMHDKLHVGDVVTISAPKNHFPLVQANKTLLLAGGIGVTPLLCMAERLASDQVSFEMHYCARSKERMAFLDRIADAAFSKAVYYHFDDGDAEQQFDLHALLDRTDKETHIYVCGPGGFIDYVRATAAEHGWPASHVHLEYFAAAPVDVSGDGAFDVTIASTGQTVHVPINQTVAQALSAAGVDIMLSCEQGVCGTCLTGVLSGTPDHRDLYLSAEEQAVNDQFTPCCSRSKSSVLVLDL